MFQGKRKKAEIKYKQTDIKLPIVPNSDLIKKLMNKRVPKCSEYKLKYGKGFKYMINGVEIRVEQGLIWTREEEAIIIQTDSELNPKPKLAQILKEVGGEEIEAGKIEWKQKHGDMTSLGSSAVTGSGNLPCKYIIYPASVSQSVDEGQKVDLEKMKEVLLRVVVSALETAVFL